MMGLIDEADFGAPDPGARDICQIRGRDGIDIDLAGVRVFEQAGDMQQRRFAGARRRHQRHRLAGPDAELGAFENIERRIALAELPAYAMQEDERLVLVLRLRRGGLAYRGGVVHSRLITRSAALRPDRAAPRATTDRAWRARIGRAP